MIRRCRFKPASGIMAMSSELRDTALLLLQHHHYVAFWGDTHLHWSMGIEWARSSLRRAVKDL